MAGGEGTRLRPLTCNLPKPMVPLMNKPVMEHIIELLKEYDIIDIGVTLQYMPQIIQEYFKDGMDFGVNMKYFIEKTPLGTAGSVKNAQQMLDDTFIVISGDALTDINLDKAIRFHKEKKSIATLILSRVDLPLEYGVVVTNSSGKITRFLEKPNWSEVFSDTANTGIYILEPEVLAYFEEEERFDFSKDLFPLLLRNNQAMYGYIADEYWCDIGDQAAYQQCHFDILDGKVNIKFDKPTKIGENIWIGENVQIATDCEVKGPVLIGDNTIIKNHAKIYPYTILGKSNIIESYTSLKKTILWDGCNIATKSQLRGCIICDKVRLKENVSVFEHAVIGDQTLINENVEVKPNIKIWPFKEIESNTNVEVNLVWGAKYTKAIFAENGVIGEINVEITPEFASRLGGAYAALLKNYVKIGISSDDSKASNMLKGSFIAGLMSGGVEVYDFGNQTLPAARYAVKTFGLDGAIHLSTISYNTDPRLFIEFINSNGVNIDRNQERNLENLFIREDFIRCELNAVKSVKDIHEFKHYYLREIINRVQNNNLNYKILIVTSSNIIKNMAKVIMQELKCELTVIEPKLNDGKMDINYISERIILDNYDIGAFIYDNGERLLLFDEKGSYLTPDSFMALTSYITLKSQNNANLVIPISAPGIIEEMANKYKGNVIRTKTSLQEVMSKINESDKQNWLNNEQFILNFDAIGSLVKIMDFMRQENERITELLTHIPNFHIVKKEIDCPWEAKGKVIRQIVEDNNHRDKIDMTEGIKIYNDDGWVLILPHAQKPVCRVIAEGYTEEYAESITDVFADKIKKISKDNN